MSTTILSRVATWVVALAIGAFYGTAGTIAHATVIGGVVPAGLLLAVVGSAGLLVSMRLLTEDRLTALACGLGMILASLLFGGRGPGGSVIVSQGPGEMLGGVNLGVVWLVAVPVLVIATVLWPDRRRGRETVSRTDLD